ncbi:MAG: C69 family dipeptidase [Arenicellales bacterium]
MCTTMIVTRGANVDGSMIVTHSDDDELSDQRLIFVPAATHRKDSKRQIMKEDYPFPRMVTDKRGPGYNTPGWPSTKPIGSIPQVKHTYAYFDGNYGIMNEHNLMMGECTNGANYEPEFVSKEQAKKEKRAMRLFYSSELSRIALERCKNARQAVELMGKLIDQYGYYSTGETLLVADQQEAWVFEMCALPDEQYHSAWVAQKVPDGDVFVAANTFRIRVINKDNEDQLFSKHLFPGTKKIGWWRPEEGDLDWLQTVSPGEYAHPYYSLRRIWRIFDRINPDLGLSPWVTDTYTTYYPFSLKPKSKIKLEQIFDLYRDHYEGTEFDLTKGIAAGPYGDPHRFVGPYDGNQNDNSEASGYGAWERAISVYYQGYTFVCQARAADVNIPSVANGILWFAPDVSYTSVFVPFYANSSDLPWSFQNGNTRTFDRESAWWVFDFVANWARLNFQRICNVDIVPLQKKLEARAFDNVAKTDRKILARPDHAVEIATQFGIEHAGEVLENWWHLAELLIAKYSDGYINKPAMDREYAVDIGYPAHWLASTNYYQGPISYRMKP